MDGRCQDAQLAQVVNLVFHQRYQGGDDNANTFQGHGWHLEGDAFSTACGHQAERVAAQTDRLDDVALDTAEVIVTPVFLEYFLIGTHVLVFLFFLFRRTNVFYL